VHVPRDTGGECKQQMLPLFECEFDAEAADFDVPMLDATSSDASRPQAVTHGGNNLSTHGPDAGVGTCADNPNKVEHIIISLTAKLSPEAASSQDATKAWLAKTVTLQGTARRVMPLAQGQKVRIDIEDMAEADIDVLSTLGSVSQVGESDVRNRAQHTKALAQDKQDRKRAVVGAMKQSHDLLAQAMQMHGVTAPARASAASQKKRRRMARRIVEIAAVHTRVATADLAEAKEGDSGAESD
jgi:hypothetical protein